MIKVFTPSFADEADTNAQNLSVKEIVARLDPGRVAVTMLHEGPPDPRIAARPNTKLLRWRRHGNTVTLLLQILASVPDIYFFPREGPLDAAFLKLRRYGRLKTALISYVVSGGLDAGSYPETRNRHIREADAVFANNSYLSQLLEEKMRVPVAGIVYDAADRRYFFPAMQPRNPNSQVYVLCAGSFRPLKRVPMVVRQAALWPDVQFRIAGTGEEEQTCRSLAAELGCRNTFFLGHISPAQLGEEMRRADLFLFPSIVEGHPQVLVQAASSGLPIVAMQAYRPDYVVEGVTGFLAANDEELSARLAQLIHNPGLRSQMSQAANMHARKFDWDSIAGQWQDEFLRVAAKRQSDHAK
jgi:glycosyltransferase involved in cell wall biosynthesis